MTIEAGTVYVDVRADTSGLTRSTSGIGSSITRTLGPILKVGAVALGTAVVGGMAVGLTQASNMQQVEIAFKTMLGSKSSAASMIKDLQVFAANTPFDFPGLTSSAQKLLAMGFSAESIIPTLEATGNAVAAIGGSAADVEGVTMVLGQIQAKGKLTAEEMMQLAERGVFSWQMLADQLGVSTAKAMEMVSAGQVSAAEATDAFIANSNDKFGGMMDKQSKTLGGVMSNLKDTVLTGLGQVMRPLADLAAKVLPPLIERLQPAFKWVSNLFKAIFDGKGPLKELGGTIKGVFIKALETFRDVASELWDNILKPLFSFIGDNIKTFAEIAAIILVVVAAVKVFNMILSAARLIIMAVNFVLAMNPFALIAIAVIALAYIIYKNWDSIKAFLLGVWESLKAAWNVVWNVIKSVAIAVWNALKAPVVAYFNFYKAIFNAIKATAIAIWNGVKAVITGVWNGIKAVWNGAKSFFSDIWHGIKDTATTIWDGIVEVVRGAINGILSAYNSIDIGFHITIPDIPGVPGRGNTYGVDDIFPDVGLLAKGGIITRPMLAMVGEAGPEAVIPLSKMNQMNSPRIVDFKITNWEEGRGILRLEMMDTIDERNRFDKRLRSMS